MPSLASTTVYLDCEHFAIDVVELARDLVGRTLVVRGGDRERSGLIVETEAYGGSQDPASHAAFRPGGRAAVMAGPPGVTYVYAAYGVYPCLTIVAEAEGSPAAVLIRGALLPGERRPILGPGKLSRALGVTLEDHGLMACGERFGVSRERVELPIRDTGRIGITRGQDLLWRFLADVSGLAT